MKQGAILAARIRALDDTTRENIELAPPWLHNGFDEPVTQRRRQECRREKHAGELVEHRRHRMRDAVYILVEIGAKNGRADHFERQFRHLPIDPENALLRE